MCLLTGDPERIQFSKFGELTVYEPSLVSLKHAECHAMLKSIGDLEFGWQYGSSTSKCTAEQKIFKPELIDQIYELISSVDITPRISPTKDNEIKLEYDEDCLQLNILFNNDIIKYFFSGYPADPAKTTVKEIKFHDAIRVLRDFIFYNKIRSYGVI